MFHGDLHGIRFEVDVSRDHLQDLVLQRAQFLGAQVRPVMDQDQLQTFLCPAPAAMPPELTHQRFPVIF